jgi:hypothetical protein
MMDCERLSFEALDISLSEPEIRRSNGSAEWEEEENGLAVGLEACLVTVGEVGLDDGLEGDLDEVVYCSFAPLTLGSGDLARSMSENRLALGGLVLVKDRVVEDVLEFEGRTPTEAGAGTEAAAALVSGADACTCGDEGAFTNLPSWSESDSDLDSESESDGSGRSLS